MARKNPFTGTRVRFQRVRDARFFGGWVVWFDGSSIVVNVGIEQPFETGELYFFQAYGADKCSLFPGECTGQEQGHVRFKVLKRPRVVQNTEEVRLANAPVKCTLPGSFGGRFVEVVDVSPNGLGICAPFSLVKDQTLDLELETPNGIVSAVGTVKNCRSAKSGYGYRIGLTIKIPDRSMQGRWRNLFFDVA